MKILVSAYACNPLGGSEPGVGWTAVTRIARQHDVWVLADAHNRAGWEIGRGEGKIPENVHVRFLGVERPCSQDRYIAHIQSWLNYSRFNNRVLRSALDWHKEVGFDLCHQVTVASWRMPSPLWKLPIPFVWGPIGGAGYIPKEFRGMLSHRSRMFERARDWSTAWALQSASFRDCIRGSSWVFAANEETELLLRPHREGRPLVRLPIVSLSERKAEQFLGNRHPSSGPLRLFAGGNMEGRKGVGLALRALALAAERGVDFLYTVAGGGPEIPQLEALRDSLGLRDRVEFRPAYHGADYIRALQESDVYFLPSFRESTPVTLLEAYLAGCWPVVADTSAQGEIVRMAGGIAVPAGDMDQIVADLAKAIQECARDRLSLPAKAEAARENVLRYFHSARYDQAIAEAYGESMRAYHRPAC